MELRHLRYFIAVAEELHFSRAAERLHISQPPLSRQIQDLERELGIELFHRNRTVELTPAGGTLLELARRALDAVAAFARAADALAVGGTPPLRVGLPAGLTDDAVPAAIRVFREQLPEVELQLVVDSSRSHVRAVQAELLDAAFVRRGSDQADELPFVSLFAEDWVLAMPGDHPLAAHPLVTREQLRGQALLFPSRRSEPVVHSYLLDHLDGLVTRSDIALETASFESARSGVAAGLGIAIVPAGSATLLHGGDVVHRPFAPPAPVTDVALVWSPGHVGQPLDAFRDIICAVSSRAAIHRAAPAAAQRGADLPLGAVIR